MARIAQPVGQVRFTNVAVVRYTPDRADLRAVAAAAAAAATASDAASPPGGGTPAPPTAAAPRPPAAGGGVAPASKLAAAAAAAAAAATAAASDSDSDDGRRGKGRGRGKGRKGKAAGGAAAAPPAPSDDKGKGTGKGKGKGGGGGKGKGKGRRGGEDDDDEEEDGGDEGHAHEGGSVGKGDGSGEEASEDGGGDGGEDHDTFVIGGRRQRTRRARAAVVRAAKGEEERGEVGPARFEIATYRNKVLSWRAGTERDIHEVLQAGTVFTDVSRGVVASEAQLLEAFGTTDHIAAARIVLERGEVEVSDRERAIMMESTIRDIASIVADKCVNPVTSRPYTVSLLLAALKDVHFGVVLGKAAKAQALKAIDALAKHMPIARARMRLRLALPTGAAPDATRLLRAMHAGMEPPPAAPPGTTVLDAVLEPGHYRNLEEFVARTPGATLEVLALAAVSSATGDDLGSGSEGEGGGRTAAAASGGAGSGGAGGGAGGSEASVVAAAALGTGMAVTRVALPGRSLTCTTCGDAFDGPNSHREHFRSDYHRFNLKRKSKGAPTITADAFAALTTAERDAVLKATE